MVAPVVNMTNTVKHNGISGIPTQLLVLHSAECPLRGGYAQSLTNWANTSNVIASWQRFVDPIARVRMVPDQYAAWHASEANPMSIGWEQAGYAAFSRAQWETPEGLKQLDNLAYDMAEVAIRDGIPPVWLTTDQVEAVTHGGNRSIKGFCLHAQIDPDMRTDPGSNYPYDRLMNRIKHYMGNTSGAAIAPQADDIQPAPNPEPTPQPKEWYEMPIPKADLDAIARAVHHAQLPLGAKDTLSNEWWLSKVIPEGIDSLAKTMASQNAQVRNLVSAVAALAKGESFDEAKLLAGVQAAAAAGVKEAIDSIDTTVNLKEQP